MTRPVRTCSLTDCDRPHRRNGLCDMHDQRMKRTGTTAAPRRTTLAERFWVKVERRGPAECWTWTGALNEHGYGVINLDGRHSGSTVKAHRVALMLAGVAVDGLVVRHSCDNPPCVNPAHLSIGTPRDNAADMVDRGRSAKGSRAGTHKLVEAEVAEIRRRYVEGELQRTLAAEFGVARSTISRVVNRKGWLHVPDAMAVAALTGTAIEPAALAAA